MGNKSGDDKNLQHLEVLHLTLCIFLSLIEYKRYPSRAM